MVLWLRAFFLRQLIKKMFCLLTYYIRTTRNINKGNLLLFGLLYYCVVCLFISPLQQTLQVEIDKSEANNLIIALIRVLRHAIYL